MTTENGNPKSEAIDSLDTLGILRVINEEDTQVAAAVQQQLPAIARSVDMAVGILRSGGRIVYIGAGTSGRIAALDASECPTTFNSQPDWFQAIVAGGTDTYSGGAEDNRAQAASDLRYAAVGEKDLIVGIAASGKTPYTHAGLEYAKSVGATTLALVCVSASPMADEADLAIAVDVGPEVLTGSTRMKAGTAQKMVLNMFSTATMIRMGMTYDNWMINVRMTNEKLRARGIRILEKILGVEQSRATELVRQSGGELKIAVLMGRLGCRREEAQQRLGANDGNLRRTLEEL